MSIKDVQAEFEMRWVVILRAYRPLLRADEGESLVHLLSAIKGLAWNCYLQGRTDEMGRQHGEERRLTRLRIAALIKRRDPETRAKERRDA